MVILLIRGGLELNMNYICKQNIPIWLKVNIDCLNYQASLLFLVYSCWFFMLNTSDSQLI